MTPSSSATDPRPATADEHAAAVDPKPALAFIPNAGQVDSTLRYHARAAGVAFGFADHGVVMAFADPVRTRPTLALRFEGANAASSPEARGRPIGAASFIRGSDPAGWRTGLPTYGEVVYREVWPGIDLAFRGDGGSLKYEFTLAPGADPDRIRLTYDGVSGVTLDPRGDLLVETGTGDLRDTRPTSYVIDGARRVPVDSRFMLRDERTYGFDVGARDTTLPLVIDPGLVYSTLLGGTGGERGAGLAVDSLGNAYVTGRTRSLDLPTTSGAFDRSQNGGWDVFIAKLDPTGSTLLYSTFVGGSADDEGRSIAIDAQGNAYVTGITSSADFPTTAGAFQRAYFGCGSAFVLKLNASGSALSYSTYLSGTIGGAPPCGGAHSEGFGIAVDGAGDAFVTGGTGAYDFPTTAGVFQPDYHGCADAFVTKLNPTGTGPIFSSYLGGGPFGGDPNCGTDQGRAIAIDAAGNAYVTGVTAALDFPTTPGAYSTTHQAAQGTLEGFVSKIDPTASTLLYSTYVGGTGGDETTAIAIDHTGSAYVTGLTWSRDFPTTPGAFRTTIGTAPDTFVVKLNMTGSALTYSTLLGGAGDDEGRGIAVDGAGSAYVTGWTDSSDFPTTPGALSRTPHGGTDVFVTKLNATGSALVYSTYLGGAADDNGRAIIVDAAGAVFVAGGTGSGGFPTTPGAFDTTQNGLSDAFVAKLSLPGGAPAALALAPKTGTDPTGAQHCVTATVTDASATAVPQISVRFRVQGSDTLTGSGLTNAAGQTMFCYSVAELPGSDSIHAFADTNGNAVQDAGEPFDDAAETIVLPASTLGCSVTLGGRIATAAGDKATFGGTAMSATTLGGHEEYQDHGPVADIDVRSTSVLALVCGTDRTSATVYGEAIINGTGRSLYRIDVGHTGAPGGGGSYRILLGTGYDSGRQALAGGDVQIR